MIVLAPDVPVMETPVDSSEALTFWKLATDTASPVVWSTLARLTVAAARSSSVLVPLPPSIDTSEL